jgi:hypothetical protein
LRSFAASLGLGQGEDIQETAPFLLARLATDHRYPGIAEFVSRHFFFHLTVLMDGQPMADSCEDCIVILNIDDCERLKDRLTHFFAEHTLIAEDEDGVEQQRTRKIVLGRVRAVLILHLCLSNSDELGQLAKPQRVITFPLEIDLRHLIPA